MAEHESAKWTSTNISLIVSTIFYFPRFWTPQRVCCGLLCFLSTELNHTVRFIDQPLPMNAPRCSDISSIDGQCIMSVIARPAACPFNPADLL